jgi:hypothetical protein
LDCGESVTGWRLGAGRGELLSGGYMATRNKHSSNAIKPGIPGLKEGLAIVLYKNTRPQSANVRSLLQAFDWLGFPDF